MRKKKRETWPFAHWSDPAAGREHLVQIVSAGCRDGKAWVRWKHLDGDQAGRTREEYLPLPIRPEGLTADLCRACGLTVDPQLGIEAEQVVGRLVRVVFEASPSGTICAAAFSPFVEDKAHEPDA